MTQKLKLTTNLFAHGSNVAGDVAKIRFRHTTNKLSKNKLYQYLLEKQFNTELPQMIFVEQDEKKKSDANVGLYLIKDDCLYKVELKKVFEFNSKEQQ